ncbi:hypothetical protein ABZY81_39310 [Streptomyces sp. NPDC006514]
MCSAPVRHRAGQHHRPGQQAQGQADGPVPGPVGHQKAGRDRLGVE